MAIIRNKIIFLVSQRKCFTTNKNTITLDYIIICRIYIGCNPIVYTACCNKRSCSRTINNISIQNTQTRHKRNSPGKRYAKSTPTHQKVY